ncbi:MAG: dihydrofolate reductase family protein [Clostridia bacterium]|nr:dihydrofolate reductase family protein [Clostridia bacterium]
MDETKEGIQVNRPKVICHMTTSIDGKVTGEFLGMPQCERATEIYYEINRDYHADAFACGRVTMEGSFTGGWHPDLTAYQGVSIPREDYVADKNAKFFAVSFDRKGRLGWKTPCIVDEDPGYGGAHIIEVVLEGVSDAYLAYLRKAGVSYIFAGQEEMDLSLALEKIRNLFGIKTLLLEGGGIINGAFARAGVIDELSLVIAPVTADAQDKPLLMDAAAEAYELADVKQYDGGVVWMNYQMKR